MFPFKRVLISGGAGFIGSATAAALFEQGVEVTILDNLLPQIHGTRPESSPTYKKVARDAQIIVGDVRNNEVWERALANQEAVFHFAALTGTGQSMYEVAGYTDVNVGGTARLLDCLVNGSHHVARLVLASSRSIYGEGKYLRPSTGEVVYPKPRSLADMEKGIFTLRCERTGETLVPLPTDEDSKVSPASLYSATKLSQEHLVSTVCQSLGIGAIALRYQNVYGPGQSLNNPYTGILSIFARNLLSGEEINVFEDGKAARDFVYIDDVVEANLAAMRVPAKSVTEINVGTGVPTTIVSVVETLSRILRRESSYRVTGNFRAGDIRHNIADTSRMERLLGIRAKTDFEDGVQKFLAWVAECKEEPDRSTVGYAASLREMKSKGLMR